MVAENKCEVCGEEYEEGAMFYDDTCDECAIESGLDIGEGEAE